MEMMDLMRLDLNLFVVFDVVYAEGNLTRAAEILHVTQPAVSNALARLRDHFDDPLFVRAGRSMAPTPAARSLIGPVREALRRLQSGLEAHGRFSAEATERVFHVAMNDVLASLVIPPLLGLLRQRAPNVRLQVHEVPRPELESELGAGTLDLALDIPQLGRGRLQALPLLENQRYVCVLRRRHPLLRGKLTLDTVLAAPQINVSTRRRGRSFIELALGRIGRQPNVVLRLPHYQPAFHTVLASDLILAAPASLAARYDVATRPLPFEVPPPDTLLYWHRNAERDPANAWLREQLVAAGQPRRASAAARRSSGGRRSP